MIVSYDAGGPGALSQPCKHGGIANRVQLTTDGFRPYLMAVEDNFGADIDYAILVKVCGRGTREREAPE